MREEKVTDEMLMAFADGELEAEEEAAIGRAVAVDAALAAKLRAFTQSRLVARDAFSGLLSAPVPDRLVTAALGRAGSASNVTWLPRRFRSPATALPLAASFILVACIGGFLAGQAMHGPAAAPFVPLSGEAALAAAIAGMPSGESIVVADDANGLTVTAVGSYRVAGGVCRIFEAADATGGSVRGLGCDHGAGWHVPLLVAAAPSADYSPAAAAGVGSIDAYLDALEAEGPLNLAEEETLISDGWLAGTDPQ